MRPGPCGCCSAGTSRTEWQPSRLTLSDTVTGTALATDTGTRTLYLFVANACCPRVATSYLTTSMDDPVLATASAKGAPVSTGGTGLTRDLVRLTGGDPGAARMLRDDAAQPRARIPGPRRPSASRPGQAAAPTGYSFRARDLAVGLAVLATIALMVILLRAETVAVRRSTVRRRRRTVGRAAAAAALGRADPRRWWPAACCCPGCGDC